MSKKVLLLLLILIIIIIISGTIYILVTPSVNVEKPNNINKKNELVSETIHDEEVEMLFNIYLNNTRHKFKWVYRLNEENNKNNLIIEIYLDGYQVFKEVIDDNLKYHKMSTLWKNNEEYSLLAREINSFNIINSSGQDYLVFYITFHSKPIKEIVYIMDEKGHILNKEGILKRDNTKKSNDLFYSDNNLLKVENNKIYYLLEKDETIEEYEITINNSNLIEKLINVYDIESSD